MAIVTEAHRFSPRWVRLEADFFTNGDKKSTKKLHFISRWMVMLGSFGGGFDSRDIESEMMGKLRAIAPVEPIKADAVFVADFVCCVDG